MLLVFGVYIVCKVELSSLTYITKWCIPYPLVLHVIYEYFLNELVEVKIKPNYKMKEVTQHCWMGHVQKNLTNPFTKIGRAMWLESKWS